MKNNKPTFDLKQRINTALSLSAPAVKMQEGGLNKPARRIFIANTPKRWGGDQEQRSTVLMRGSQIDDTFEQEAKAAAELSKAQGIPFEIITIQDEEDWNRKVRPLVDKYKGTGTQWGIFGHSLQYGADPAIVDEIMSNTDEVFLGSCSGPYCAKEFPKTKQNTNLITNSGTIYTGPPRFRDPKAKFEQYKNVEGDPFLNLIYGNNPDYKFEGPAKYGENYISWKTYDPKKLSEQEKERLVQLRALSELRHEAHVRGLERPSQLPPGYEISPMQRAGILYDLGIADNIIDVPGVTIPDVLFNEEPYDETDLKGLRSFLDNTKEDKEVFWDETGIPWEDANSFYNRITSPEGDKVQPIANRQPQVTSIQRKKQGGTIQEGGTVNRLQQMMGYKDNSPYKNLPYQDIYSDRITMQGVSRPLIANTDTGVTTVMQPGEEYYFPGASKVREVPMYKNGGELKDRENFQQMKQNTYINPLTRQLGKSIRKFQNSGNTSTGTSTEDDAWIRKILEFEATKGSATGGGLSNWGYNSPKGYRYDSNTNLYVKKGSKPDSNGKYKTEDLYQQTGKYTPPKTIDEAVKRFKEEYLPDFKKYPIEVRKRLADYAYNSGRNINQLLMLASGDITLDEINDNTKELVRIKDQYGPDSTEYKDAIRKHAQKLNEKWEESKDKIEKQLNDPNFVSKLNAAKDKVAETTNMQNGKTNPSYKASWYDRVRMFEPYQITDETKDEVFKKQNNWPTSSNEGFKSSTSLPPSNANQQANTQPPATNAGPTGPAAPDQTASANNNSRSELTEEQKKELDEISQIAEKGTKSEEVRMAPTMIRVEGSDKVDNAPPASSANLSAASISSAADDYAILESESGDPYEYRYNKKTDRYETKKKGSSSWIVLDDSTDRLKEARKAIEGRYGEQVQKVKEETAKSSAAPVETTATGAGAAGTTTKPKTWQEDVASREWKEPIEVDSTYKGSGFFRPDRMYVLPEEGPKDAWWNRPGQSQPSRPQGTTSGTTPPSTNTPSGSTVIPPSSIRRSEIREFPGRIFDPIPEEQDRTVPGLKDRNPIMRERPYEILEPDMPGNQGSVGQGGTSGATDKRDPVNIPTLPTSPLKPINPSQSSSASIPTPTVKDNAVRIGNVDFSKANASDNNSSDFQGWYGAGNKTFYQTEDGTIKIVTDGRGRFYLENENQLFEVDPPDSTDVKGSIRGERYYDDEQKDFVEKPNSYDDYWKSQLAYIKKNQKKGIPAKEFYGKKRADDYGSWDYRKGSFLQGGPIRVENIDQAKVGKFLKGIGNTLSDYGRGMVDGFGNWTGTFDLENSGYKTKFGRSFSDVADTLTSTTGKIGRTIADKFVPGLGSAAGALGGLAGGARGNSASPAMTQSMPQQSNALSGLQMLQQFLPMQGQGQGNIMSMLSAPALGNYQEGAQVQQPQPAIYTNEVAPTVYKTGLSQSSLEGAAYKPTELKMEYLPTPGTRNNQEQQGAKIITIYDKTTNQPRRIYVDSTGKMLGYADSQEDMYSETINKQQSNHQDLYQLAQQWKEKNQPVAQQQQGGPIITSMLYRNMDRNNSIKNNISVNKTKLQNVINLSNKVNPYRLQPGGVYKNGGMIMEGGVSASRAGFSRQPITGASSTGPLGPKRTETPDYTNKGVRSLMDLPSNEYVPTENLIPIQTERGEMIVLPTGDLMPVMARKRHHQMQDDEVTDVTPENSYILSAHGQVRINRNEADLLITETGVKPYRLGQAQNPPTEKTLGSIMTKSIMKPAEVAKRINSLFPVLSSSNPFEIAANVENKINRKPYLEGLIQLSELDKYRKGLSEPAMSDMQQQQMQMQGQGSPMLARQGGRTISMPGIVRAQAGYYTGDPTAPGQTLDLGNYGQNNPTYWNPVGSSTPPITGATSGIPTVTVPYTDPFQISPVQTDPTGTLQARTAPGGGVGGGSNASGALSGILAPANFAARMIGAQALRGAEKRGITRERDIYGRSFNKMGSLMGLGTGLEAAMLGAQDPFVKYTETPDTYIRTMQTQTPSQLLEAQASSAYSNLPDYSQMGAAGLGAQNAAYAQGLAASSRFLGEASERDRANFNKQQELLQANMAQNVAGRLAAQRATDAAVNKMLSGYGNLANRYTQGLVDLTGQRMGADLGLSRAEQASQAGLYGNRLNAFTTFTGDLTAGGDELLKFYGLGK